MGIRTRRWLGGGVLSLCLAFPGCSGSSGSGASLPSASTSVPAGSTPAPTPAASPTAAPAPTPTPTPQCSFSISEARFDPSDVRCPLGTTTQQMRLVFEIETSNALPVTLNRVSTFGSQCRHGAGTTCTWPDGPLNLSVNVVPAGTRMVIAGSTPFSCGSAGGESYTEIVVKSLFVNTSCGPAREISVSNIFVIR